MTCLLFLGWLATEHLGALLERVQVVEQRPRDPRDSFIVDL